MAINEAMQLTAPRRRFAVADLGPARRKARNTVLEKVDFRSDDPILYGGVTRWSGHLRPHTKMATAVSEL
jgi:hypothetical protein